MASEPWRVQRNTVSHQTESNFQEIFKPRLPKGARSQGFSAEAAVPKERGRPPIKVVAQLERGSAGPRPEAGQTQGQELVVNPTGPSQSFMEMACNCTDAEFERLMQKLSMEKMMAAYKAKEHLKLSQVRVKMFYDNFKDRTSDLFGLEELVQSMESTYK